ncbi:MAG: SDR family NAD(P)-dependent oxidoreductase [Pseudomonadota bacterium]
MAIVITGANRGIGRGLRDLFTERGDTVVGTTRGEMPEEAGHWVTVDLQKPEAFAHLASELDSVTVDLLVCNAGVYLDKGMKLADGYAHDVWDTSFSVNVTAVFLTIQALLPNLQMSDAPRIAIISSAMGSTDRAPGGSYAYRASKAAVTNLGRNLARDLEPLGIAVGVYHPGWVQTDMGGSAAELTLDQSLHGLAARFDELSLAKTGTVVSYNGETVPF